MTKFKQSRRKFLGSAAAAGTTGLLLPLGSGSVSWADGKKVLKCRAVRDMAILDPGYMVGGVEMDTQYATMPTLVDYYWDDDGNLKSKGSGAVIGNGEIIGVAVAVDGWCKYYPFGHEGGGNLDKKRILSWLTDVCAVKSSPQPDFQDGTIDLGLVKKEDCHGGSNIKESRPLLLGRFAVECLDHRLYLLEQS